MKPDSVGLETMRHSAAHVMASAVQRLWPDALFDIGPDTEDGFYYDFDLKHRLTEEDFPAIEAEMAKIVAEDLPFVREEKTREEVWELMKGRGQTYLRGYCLAQSIGLARGTVLHPTTELGGQNLLCNAQSRQR